MMGEVVHTDVSALMKVLVHQQRRMIAYRHVLTEESLT